MPNPTLFSIIIPTCNRPDRLAECLASITHLNYPISQFEVIVVDDGSRTPLKPVTAGFENRLNLTILTQPNAGPAAARNNGAQKAKGRYIAFTDDDCRPAPDWLRKLHDRFEKSPECMIGGKTVNALPHNLFSQASQKLISYLYEYYNPDHNQARFLTSNNIAVPRDLFQAFGGFDPDYPGAAAEDRDFCDRWLFHNHRMVYDPSVVVYHYHNLTLTKFWKQHFGYGCGASRFHKARIHRSTGRIRMEPVSFYIDLLLYPFFHKKGNKPIPVAFLMLVSQIANAAGFFQESVKQKLKSIICGRTKVGK
ncbi:MAG: glycosyltransferase [Desulfobacteraceae bacterium]|nr:MAG: glycosyltransferase [Desulfobacteraceae bacterium]